VHASTRHEHDLEIKNARETFLPGVFFVISNLYACAKLDAQSLTLGGDDDLAHLGIPFQKAVGLDDVFQFENFGDKRF